MTTEELPPTGGPEGHVIDTVLGSIKRMHGEWMQNTTTPIQEHRYCHCHNWRIDDCPNVAVSLLVQALQGGRNA
jgi:hypothetical protein